MFGKKILLFSVILLITIGVASAGDNTTHTFSELQEIIDNADENAVIELDSDYSYDEGDSAIQIHKTLTINGNNHVLDGKGKSQIMKTSNK